MALVINGDPIDFLAQPQARYFDPFKAVDKLRRIARDTQASSLFSKRVQTFVS